MQLGHLCVVLQDMYDEILKHKLELDKVRDKGDAIVQRSSDPRVSNNMMQLYTKYQSLCSSSKVRSLISQTCCVVCMFWGVKTV